MSTPSISILKSTKKAPCKGAFLVVRSGLAAESSAKAPKIPQDRRKFSSCKGLKSAGSVSALAYVRDCFPASQPRQSQTPRAGERLKATLTLWLQIHPLPPRRGEPFWLAAICFIKLFANHGFALRAAAPFPQKCAHFWGPLSVL